MRAMKSSSGGASLAVVPDELPQPAMSAVAAMTRRMSATVAKRRKNRRPALPADAGAFPVLPAEFSLLL
jgi:hypothetical protein